MNVFIGMRTDCSRGLNKWLQERDETCTKCGKCYEKDTTAITNDGEAVVVVIVTSVVTIFPTGCTAVSNAESLSVDNADSIECDKMLSPLRFERLSVSISQQYVIMNHQDLYEQGTLMNYLGTWELSRRKVQHVHATRCWKRARALCKDQVYRCVYEVNGQDLCL